LLDAGGICSISQQVGLEAARLQEAGELVPLLATTPAGSAVFILRNYWSSASLEELPEMQLLDWNTYPSLWAGFLNLAA